MQYISMAVMACVLMSCTEEIGTNVSIDPERAAMPTWIYDLSEADIQKIKNEMLEYRESERLRHGPPIEVRGCCGTWPDHPQILYATMVIEDAEACLAAMKAKNQNLVFPAMERLRMIHIQNQVNHDLTDIPDEQSLQQGGQLDAASRRQLP